MVHPDPPPDRQVTWRRYFVPVALAAIIVLGAIFRFTGINWDDYQHLHPDERFLTMVETALSLPGSQDIGGELPVGCLVWGGYFDTKCSPLNPYNRGQSSFVYGTFPLFLVKFVGDLIGQSEYDQIFLVGRYLSGVFDLSTVLLIFLIGRRLFGTRVGLIAGLLLTASVLDIQQSHFFTVDTFANVPLLVAFWFALNIMDGRGRLGSFILAGLFFGLSLAARINLVPFAAIIALAGFYRFIRAARAEPAAPLAEPSRTFANSAAGLPDGEPGARVQGRRNQWGPFSVEIESQRKPQILAEGEQASPRAGWLEALLFIGLELSIAAVAALVAFRIAQPYAFRGLGLNPQFTADMNYARDLIGGQLDIPPMHQWTARPDYWFPFVNMVLWGLGPGMGLAGTLGFVLAGYRLARHRDWSHLLVFFWVGGLFFYLGQQVAKTDRYYLPLYPFIALLAAFFLNWLWEQASTRIDATRVAGLAGRSQTLVWRAAAAVIIAAAIGYTLFWAAAFTSIYTRPVSRITASRWIYQNVPRGSALGNEHWDDPLPLRIDGKDGFATFYKGVELQWYGEDTPEKRPQAVEWLDQVDYINLTSNRLYLSIPRLPLRYPMTTAYYQALFDGSLGFKLVATFTSRPSFLGIEINDDDAEESFTVYDHPKVLIFQKTAGYSHDKTAALFDSVDLDKIIRQKPLDATLSHNAFQLPAAELAADRVGGTWAEIFNPDDLINRIPVIAWLILLALLGWIAFPIAFVVFRNFADRGYAFARAIGVLLLGWGAWTLSGFHVLPFSRESILVVLAGMVVLAAIAAWRRWAELKAFIRERLTLLLIEELVFSAFFFLSLWIRFGNPDLWHPSFGGEKPMDFAYLNAIIKTTWFPPYNPWFDGGYINYYYFGQLLSATLLRLTGIVPEVGYNLLLPMFFGLTALGAFGVALNLVIAGGRTQDPAPADDGPAARGVPGVALIAGVAAAGLVLIIGNLGEIGVLLGALQKLGGSTGGAPVLGGLTALLRGLGTWIVERKAFPIALGDWYWIATRVIPETINEFPFFTFLYADLHAHLMSLAYTLVAVGIALHAVLSRGRFRWYDLGVAGMVLGALRPLNTWDYPTYLAAVGAALVIGLLSDPVPSGPDRPANASWESYLLALILLFVQILLVVIPLNALGVKITVDLVLLIAVLAAGVVLGWFLLGAAFDPVDLISTVGWRLIAIIALSGLFYLPYLLFYGAAYTSVELWKGDRTTLQGFMTVHGIFLFLVATYLVIANLRAEARGADPQDPATAEGVDEWWILMGVGVLIASVVIWLLGFSAIAVVLPLIMLALWLLLRRDAAPVHRFLALLALAGLLLIAMVEVIVLKGDIGRMNTVFKFYLQAWVLFSVVGGAGVLLIYRYLIPAVRPGPAGVLPERPGAALEPITPATPTASFDYKYVWWGALAVLIAVGLLYPLFATWAKVHDRYVADSPPGLNGMDYMLGATYGENGHDISLAPDHAAIQWIRENVKGSPVIAEANTGLYRWGDRISIYTGLPTVIGWDWHTKQQYALLDGAIIDHRLEELRGFYNDADTTEARQFIKRYDVSYIYVGPLEQAVYDPVGLAKFESMTASGDLAKVYDSDGVRIYQVNPAALALQP